MPIDLENGENDPAETTAKAKPGRPSNAARASDLEKDIKEQLEELGEWMRRRDPDFASTFLDDVPRMAKFLGTRAGKHARLAKALRVVFAKDGPLAALRAFGRSARVLGGKIGAYREARVIEGEFEELDEFGNPVPPAS